MADPPGGGGRGRAARFLLVLAVGLASLFLLFLSEVHVIAVETVVALAGLVVGMAVRGGEAGLRTTGAGWAVGCAWLSLVLLTAERSFLRGGGPEDPEAVREFVLAAAAGAAHFAVFFLGLFLGNVWMESWIARRS